jgi:Enoyl-CoA hydratase/carnithine racemase
LRVEPDLIARREGAVGVIRLNRPKAINAVTLEMFRDIDKALDQFESDPAVGLILLEGAGDRGLCAGGDIRALYESSKVKGDLGKILWREEYILNARIAKFPKPYVAFMDGIVMGGGVGAVGAWPSSRCHRADQAGDAEVASASFRMSAAPGCSRARRERSVPISA